MAQQSAKRELRASTVHPRMEVTTRYQSDFPHKEKYPLPPKQAIPAPATLEIKMNNRWIMQCSEYLFNVVCFILDEFFEMIFSV